PLEGGIDDVTGVGGVVSVFARVDWRGPEERVLRNWPLHALFVRRDGALRPLALGPDRRDDGGTLAARQYAHDGLGLRIKVPDGIAARRRAVGPFEVQVDFTAAAAPDCEVLVRGCSEAPHWHGERMPAVDWLSGGASFAGLASP